MGRIMQGDALDKLKELPDESVQCVVTSPPYWGLRDYGSNGQLGLEKTPEEYVEKMVEVFREVRRVLRDDGTLWLNLGDSYSATTGSMTYHPQQSRNGPQGVVGPRDKHPSASRANLSTFKDFGHLKPKDLVGIPWRVAFALQADGWYLRSDIIWSKPNPMPESVKDRCTKAHEYIFMLTKSARYYFDGESISEPAVYGTDLGILRGVSGVGDKDGVAWHAPSIAKRQNDGVDSRTAGSGTRNKRSVWTVATKPYSGAHFATFPPEIPEICIKAGTKEGDTVLDPFAGAGTTLEVAKRLGRDYIGIELSQKYIVELIRPRLENINPLFT